MAELQLFQFAYIPRYDDAINALAGMADPEDWDFSDSKEKNVILKNYIEHTFRCTKRMGQEKCRPIYLKGLFMFSSESNGSNDLYQNRYRNSNKVKLVI